MLGSFESDNSAFEDWLHSQCDVVSDDLDHKHTKMEESAFSFLRATFFRWAKEIANVCPDCADAPKILAVGDIHVENYGVWRDREGRLVWGVNDFDEAARTPYTFDLIRLTASAMLSPSLKLSDEKIAAAILAGYQAGLAKPGPILLDRDNLWMRELAMATDEHRVEFWAQMDASKRAKAPSEAREALVSDLPRRAEIIRFIKRRSGTGSLGKPRFAVIAHWRGGDLVREAKAVTASSWSWANGKGGKEMMLMDLARSPSRAPDPFLDVRRGYIVRRLAPDSRKIEFDSRPRYELEERVLTLMGQDLASVHGARKRSVIVGDMAKRRGLWLAKEARAAATFVEADFRAWRAGRRRAVAERA